MTEGIADVSAIYDRRLLAAGLERRDRVWKVLCTSYFQSLFSPDGTTLDLACGYGEFINNIRSARKLAIDANPDAKAYLSREVEFHRTMAHNLSHIPSLSIDAVFTSNFLEHLPDKAACDSVLKEVLRVLRPGGRFVVMGPNIRFCSDVYWDFYDHYLPLSDRSLAEGLAINGYEVESVIPQFLPFTMAGKQPTADWLIRCYLAMPLAWRLLGKQFLLVARKPP
jgi:ubiquinone/menaquinone biosynthesis C-methylase UbiE